MSVVARGESAGAGAGAVAKRATTDAGTDAELDVLAVRGLNPPDDMTVFKTGPAGLKVRGGSLGGG